MKTVKTSLSLTKVEREWLSRHGQGMSRQLREDIATLQSLKRTRPPFSLSKTEVLKDGLAGFVYEPYHAASLPRLLAQEIRDADRLGGLGAKWQADALALAESLEDLDSCQAWAVAEEMRRLVGEARQEKAGEEGP